MSYSKDDLLTKFYKYIKLVEFHIIKETTERHNYIVNWYNKLLNDDREALSNYPKELDYGNKIL